MLFVDPSLKTQLKFFTIFTSDEFLEILKNVLNIVRLIYSFVLQEWKNCSLVLCESNATLIFL